MRIVEEGTHQGTRARSADARRRLDSCWRYLTDARVVIFTLALIGLSITLTSRHVSDVHHPAESIRVYTAMAIAEHRTICVNPIFDRFFPGWSAAGVLPNIDAAVRGDCYLQDKAPLQALVAVPPTVLWAWSGRPGGYDLLLVLLILTVVTAPCLILLFLSRRWLLSRRALTRASMDMAGLCLLLGSPFLVHLGLFVSHALVGCVVLVAMGLALGDLRNETQASSPIRLAVAGALLGCAVLLEYTTAAFIAVLILAMGSEAGSRRRIPFLLAGGLPLVLLLMGWNHLAFGGVFEISYNHKAFQQHQEIIATGVFGFSLDDLSNIWRLLFSPSRGLFFHAPWLLLSLPGFWTVLRNPRLAARWRVALGLSIPVWIVLIGAFSDWQAGELGTGPRHLLAILPLMTVLVAVALDRFRQNPPLARVSAALIVGGGLFGCVVNLVWLGVYPHTSVGLVNPTFEVALPVLWEAGPAGTWLIPGRFQWIFFAVSALGLLVLFALAFLRWCREARTSGPQGLASGLLVLVLLSSLAVMPETPDEAGQYQVWQQRRKLHDLRGHQELVNEYTLLMQQLRRRHLLDELGTFR